MTSPRISVVLIFLDEERYLAEAIESVVAQTEARWELLLVDDGSRDGSGGIARRYAERIPERVRYLQHPGGANRGMSASRNLGIVSAGADLLTFLDGDDVITPGKLEEQAAILDAHPDAAFVCGRAQFWRSWSSAAADDVMQDLGLPLDRLVSGTELLARFLADEYASPCDIMVRRAAAVAVGGYEDAFTGMYEDQAFHAKLCLAGAQAWVSGECWYRYRQHGAATTVRAKRGGGYRRHRRAFLDWIGSREGMDERPLREALAVARWPFEHPVRARAEDARRLLRRPGR